LHKWDIDPYPPPPPPPTTTPIGLLLSAEGENEHDYDDDDDGGIIATTTLPSNKITPISSPSILYKRSLYTPNANFYHGSVTSKKRTEIHKSFVSRCYDILVATVAFGMGINVPFVQSVLHFGCPRGLNNYHQESGRAGRNNVDQALSVVYYHSADFSLQKSLILTNRNVQLVQRELLELDFMQQMLHSNVCKRRIFNSTFALPVDSDNNKNNNGKSNTLTATNKHNINMNAHPMLNFCFGADIATLPSNPDDILCHSCDVCLFYFQLSKDVYSQYYQYVTQQQGNKNIKSASTLSATSSL
jgi:hypothetical protein